MRRFILTVFVAVACVLLVGTTAGCTELVSSSARSSVSGFLTSVATGAINNALNGG